MPAVSAPVPIPLASAPGLSSLASDERQVNCFVEQVGEGSDARAVIYGSAGLTSFCATPTDACRGLLEVDPLLYSVNGSTVYTVTTGGVATAIGTIPGLDAIKMARNSAASTQVLYVAATGVYYSQGGVVAAVTDPDLPSGAVDVDWMDGYFIVALADGRFFISGINAVTFDALDFATAEANADGLVACKKFRQELYLFGSETIEVWANTGAAAFPFERLPGAVIQSGCASKTTVQELGGSLYWLDQDGVVQQINSGYTSNPISIRGVHDAVRAVSDYTQIRAFTYVLGTHQFYVLTHSTFTWVYDASVGLWHERVTKNAASWRANCSAFFAGKNIFGSRQEGTLWRADETAYAEGSDEMIATLRFPRMDSFPDGGVVWRIDFDIETGVGFDTSGASADDTNPQLTLRWSVDGAKTWKGGRILPLGAKGDYKKRVRTNQLGSFGQEGIVFEITISSRVFKSLLNCYMLTEQRPV